MEKIILVSVFAFSLFLKVTIAAGAEGSPAVVNAVVPVVSPVAEAEPAKVEEKTTTIQNTINVTPNQAPAPVAIAPQGNANADAASVLGTSQSAQSQHAASMTPVLGGTAYNGGWYDHVKNSYTIGLILEVPATERFSIELEGLYAKSNINYSSFSHDFTQYSMGGNGKIYLSRGILQPYAGLGMTALRYENMSYGPSFPRSRYSQWVGAAQAIGGLDVEVTKQTAIGIRGEWVLPVLNRPGVADNGVFAYPHFEEAALMNTTFFRVMGSVRLAF